MPMHKFTLIEPVADNADDLTVLENIHNAIFLAGPCPRHDYTDDWRFEAYNILDEIGFTGCVITPTNKNYNKMEEWFGLGHDEALRKQTAWERIAMHLASAIVFWIPRSANHPARTTNIEFGEWYKQNGIFVGWPDNAEHNDYLAIKLNEQHKNVYSSLKDTLRAAVNHLTNESGIKFISDTHFGSERTLRLCNRPFADVMEMDLSIMSNWNKNVSDNDIVYHAGDFSDPDEATVLWYLNNLNFKELHWTLGNHDFEQYDVIKSVISECTRPIYLYESATCRVNGNSHKFIIAHEPNVTPIKCKPGEVVLYGHVHGKSMYKQNGIDLSVESHNFMPIDLHTVEWMADVKDRLDENVYSSNVLIEVK